MLSPRRIGVRGAAVRLKITVQPVLGNCQKRGAGIQSHKDVTERRGDGCVYPDLTTTRNIKTSHGTKPKPAQNVCFYLSLKKK